MVRGRGALACVVFALDADPADPKPGSVVVRSARMSDVVGALSPTEFAVLAPATDWVGATKLAQRLVGAIEAPTVRGQAAAPLRVRAGLEAVGNVGYAPIKPMDLLIRASAALRRGTPVDGSSSIRRYDEGGGAQTT